MSKFCQACKKEAEIIVFIYMLEIQFTGREYYCDEMKPEEIVAKIRGVPCNSNSLTTALESFKNFFSRIHKPEVYKAHSIVDSAYLHTGRPDARARLY